MRKVFGIGETILDILFKDKQPCKAVPGGSVFNGLISLGRLDVPVSFISEIGKDQVGDLILEFMRENNLSTDFVNRFPDGKSPVSLAFLNENNDADYSFYRNYPKERLEVPFPLLKEDDIVIFGSSYALDPELHDKIMEILQYAQERKAIIFYDFNFRRTTHSREVIILMSRIIENMEYADIIRGSDEDLRNIFDNIDVDRVYTDNVKFYCDHFIVTHAAQGVSLFTGKEKEHFDTPQINPVSTIGAGDSFNAGVLYGLLKYDIRYNDLKTIKKETWEKVIHCGTQLAAEVCMSYDNYISREFAASFSARL